MSFGKRLDFPRLEDISPFLFNLTLSALSFAGQPDLLLLQAGANRTAERTTPSRMSRLRMPKKERMVDISDCFYPQKRVCMALKRLRKGEIMPFFNGITEFPC